LGTAIQLLASFVLLVVSSVLLASVGRRRQQRRRQALELGAARAIERVVGSDLAELVAAAIRLRRLIEDAAASGGEMLAIEVQLGGALRRPLWRQIEDANFGHELDRVRREASAWLSRFDGLDAANRQIIDLLGLDAAPVRALVEAERISWEHDAPPAAPLRDRSDELAAVLRRSEAAIKCLRRIERELIDYRPGGYR
jgi:hypothetical protein